VHAATPPPFAFPLLLVVLATLGGVGGVVFNAVAPPNWRIIASSPAEGVDALRSAAQDASSRGYRRSAVQAGPAAIRPVAGLNPKQMAHAVLIVQVGQEMDLSDRAMVIAMITAMQETDLRNFASSRLPHSLDYPHEAVGRDFDSVGLFQQRPSQGWGTVEQLMDPRYTITAFYKRLMRVPGWERMSMPDAAQAVQRSAYPDAYRRHLSRAEQVVDALT